MVAVLQRSEVGRALSVAMAVWLVVASLVALIPFGANAECSWKGLATNVISGAVGGAVGGAIGGGGTGAAAGAVGGAVGGAVATGVECLLNWLF